MRGRGATIDRSTLLLYSLPAFALAMPTIPVYVYLPSFYADTLGLGLAVTGVVLLAARVLDVVTDPLVGIGSDRLRFRYGRRKPWIAVGAVIAAVALVRLFVPPDGASSGYLLAWVITLYLGWTLVAVPYTAWGAELSADYHQRSRITGTREALMIVGILAAGALPAAAAYAGFEERDGLAAVAWLAIAVGAPAIFLLLRRVAEPASASVHAPPPLSIAAEWRSLARNGPFVRLLLGWFVNGLANGLPAVLFPLYLEYVLKADAVERGVLIMTYFLAGVVAIPLWVMLSRRYGKHRMWCAAMVLACVSFVWVPLLEPRSIELFFAICVLTGMAFGADLALPPAMQADVIDLDRLKTGRERAGLFFALWSMSTKLALAGAVGIAFPCLAVVGFDTGQENSAFALAALAVIYALAPTVLKFVAIAMIWRHPITPRRHAVIRRRLDGIARQERAQ